MWPWPYIDAPGGFVNARDSDLPVGELSSETGVLLGVTDDVVAAVVGDTGEVATDATVPRSSLANCSLALGFDAHALPPPPLLPVGSSSSSTVGDTEIVRLFSLVRRCRRERSLRTARSVETSSGGSSLRRSASSFSRWTSASLRNTICTFAPGSCC